MVQGREQVQAMRRRLSPGSLRVNWWGILGLVSIIASTFLSITILAQILRFLRSAGEAGFPFPTG